MSLAADTAKLASNQTMAITLFWFIGVLEKSSDRIAPSVALKMINEKLSAFERVRIDTINAERIQIENQQQEEA